MTRKKYELTPEHRAQLEPWRDKWIANAMSTAPMTAATLYEAANRCAADAIRWSRRPLGAKVAAVKRARAVELRAMAREMVRHV